MSTFTRAGGPRINISCRAYFDLICAHVHVHGSGAATALLFTMLFTVCVKLSNRNRSISQHIAMAQRSDAVPALGTRARRVRESRDDSCLVPTHSRSSVNRECFQSSRNDASSGARRSTAPERRCTLTTESEIGDTGPIHIIICMTQEASHLFARVRANLETGKLLFYFTQRGRGRYCVFFLDSHTIPTT